jgi:hypothetical protein
MGAFRYCSTLLLLCLALQMRGQEKVWMGGTLGIGAGIMEITKQQDTPILRSTLGSTLSLGFRSGVDLPKNYFLELSIELMNHEYNIGTDTSYVNSYLFELEYNFGLATGKHFRIAQNWILSPSAGYMLNFRNQTWETGKGGIYRYNRKPTDAWVRFETKRRFNNGLSATLNFEYQPKPGAKTTFGIFYFRGLNTVLEGDVRDNSHRVPQPMIFEKFKSRGSYLAFKLGRDIAVYDRKADIAIAPPQTARNNFYLTVGGNIEIPTLNYERILFTNNISSLLLQTGLGFAYIPERGPIIGTPLYLHYITGPRLLKFDISAGASLQEYYGTRLLSSIGFGLRRQPREHGFFALGSIDLTYDSEENLLFPIPKVGLGLSW